MIRIQTVRKYLLTYYDQELRKKKSQQYMTYGIKLTLSNCSIVSFLMMGLSCVHAFCLYTQELFASIISI